MRLDFLFNNTNTMTNSFLFCCFLFCEFCFLSGDFKRFNVKWEIWLRHIYVIFEVRANFRFIIFGRKIWKYLFNLEILDATSIVDVWTGDPVIYSLDWILYVEIKEIDAKLGYGWHLGLLTVQLSIIVWWKLKLGWHILERIWDGTYMHELRLVMEWNWWMDQKWYISY